MYEGGWKNGNKYGLGTMYINGDKYIGQLDWNKDKEKLTTRTELNIPVHYAQQDFTQTQQNHHAFRHVAMAYELDLKPAMMDIVSFMTETTILDNTKKAVGMVKEHVTKQMDTSIQAYGMIGKDKEKLNTRTELSMDREHTTQRMETSIQANGMVITKGKEKLTTITELNIRDTGFGTMVV